MNPPDPGQVEPFATALLLVATGLLLAVSVLFSRASERFGVPVLLVFLVIGMLAGSEGVGGIEFDNYGIAFRLGTAALTLILFDGGLNTPWRAIRQAIRPAGVLATIGVALVAALVALGARLFGFGWGEALLLGAVVSSTDAAAVFAVLRGSGLHLQRKLGATLEVESGINDPMAMILTVMITGHLVAPGELPMWRAPFDVLLQIAVGGVAGYAIGRLGGRLFARLRLPAGGLYPVLSLALACLAFGVPTLLSGSGFLAVYVAGAVLGNGPLPYKNSLFRVHDALAWLSQVVMFLLLGLLVFPSRLPGVAWEGLGVALFLAFVARPLAVALCLAPFRYPARQVGYIGWVGLRGAVPIVLAIYPVLLGAPGAGRIFDVVFFVVVAGALVPGATVAWLTRRLGFERREPPPPPAVLAVESRQALSAELLRFYVDERVAVAGARLADLPFPEGSAIAMLVRGQELIPPKGATVLRPGDHVYVISRPEDRAVVQLLFGRVEEE